MTTTTRREFVNMAHILAQAFDSESRPFVFKIIGGRNVKKSLAVDAFLYAIEHNTCKKFEVPPSNRMRFENYPSEADLHLVQGQIVRDGKSISVAFTRNLWQQAAFMQEFAQMPSLLIIPKKSLDIDAVDAHDLTVHLDYIEGSYCFFHHWEVAFHSERMRNNPKVANIVDRINEISNRRDGVKSFPALKP